jgi:hypothetical protein
MLEFVAAIKKFGEKGEKTGWTYIEIPEKTVQKICPGQKKSFRVKGKLDAFPFSQVALLPMGGGGFIMCLNAAMRKAIRKKAGDKLTVQMEADKEPLQPPAAFLECLKDDPQAEQFYFSLIKSQQNYFANWIRAAKTDATQTKRIALAVNGLSRRLEFGPFVRSMKQTAGKHDLF